MEESPDVVMRHAELARHSFDFIFSLSIEFFFVWENCISKRKAPFFHFLVVFEIKKEVTQNCPQGRNISLQFFLFDISNMIFIFVYYPYSENATFNLPYKRNISGANFSKKANLPIQMVHSLTAKKQLIKTLDVKKVAAQ